MQKKKQKGVVRRLFSYMLPYKKETILCSVLMLTITMFELLRPVLIGNAIDQYITGHDFTQTMDADFHGILKIGALYLLVLTAGWLCTIWQTWVLQKTGQNIIFTIRQQVFEHVHSLPLKYFDTNPVGQIVTRITNDVEALHQMYATILIRLLKSLVKVVGLIGVMFAMNATLAGYAMVMMPLIVAMTILFKKLSRSAQRTIRTRISKLNAFLSEHISGMRFIQIFAKEEEKYKEFCDRTQSLYRANVNSITIYAIFRPMIYFVGEIALCFVIYRSGILVLQGGVTIGVMYVFINYISELFEPIQDMAEQFSTLQSAIASAEKIFTVLNEENPIQEVENPETLGEVKGKIEFRNVWFAYEEDNYVLRDVSFVIHPGEKVAFVGATGAGKSSILNLIGRYYDIQKGQILIDDVDIRELSMEEIRNAIGQVQQDVFVFTGDIESNIRLLNDQITEEAVRESAKTVRANGFIEQLPKGYKEPIGERGSNLSAGQRQLLSFARTLAFDPKILVMDEATANIDTETEVLIQEALEELMKGRTTIMVAHRLSTIQHADHIIVLHKGKIRESGTHQELLAQNGIYKKLYEVQKYSV